MLLVTYMKQCASRNEYPETSMAQYSSVAYPTFRLWRDLKISPEHMRTQLCIPSLVGWISLHGTDGSELYIFFDAQSLILQYHVFLYSLQMLSTISWAIIPICCRDTGGGLLLRPWKASERPSYEPRDKTSNYYLYRWQLTNHFAGECRLREFFHPTCTRVYKY